MPPLAALLAIVTLEQVQAKYRQVSSLTASFVQTVTYEGFDEANSFAGVLYFTRPDKIRLEVSSPEEQLIVTDGKSGWLHLPAINQAIKQDVTRVLTAVNPELFLFGESSATVQTKEQPDGGASFSFDPAPDSPYTALTITVDKGMTITSVNFTDPSGNRYDFALTNVALNPPLNPSIFTFKPPQGTTVFGPE